MTDRRTSYGLLCAALLVAGCAEKKGDADTSTVAATTAPADSSMSAGAMGASRADSARAAADPAHFNDANILAHEITGDSGEVAIATMAKGKASSAAVRQYAERLVSDHSKGQKEVTALAKKASITPQTAAGDTAGQAITHAMTRLQGLAKGAAFDTAFVNHEVEDHQQDIKDAQAMSGAAKNAEVKSLVDKSIPELQTHLDIAQKLSKAKS